MSVEFTSKVGGSYSYANLDAVTVNDGSNYVLVATLLLPGGGSWLGIHGLVGAGALTALKITRAMVPGGTHKDWLEGADFNTPSERLVDCTANPHTTAGAGTFQMTLDVTCCAELKLYAKGTSTSLALSVAQAWRGGGFGAN